MEVIYDFTECGISWKSIKAIIRLCDWENIKIGELLVLLNKHFDIYDEHDPQFTHNVRIYDIKEHDFRTDLEDEDIVILKINEDQFMLLCEED